ncbi:MAG: response regulator [Planctomycetota bacterium]
MTRDAAFGILPGKRVLVVEDEVFIADYTECMLEAMQCKVLGPVPDEDAALALIEREKPEAAVLDINLGTHTAFRIADRLRELGIPFIFTTGYERDSFPPAYNNAPLVSKPIDELQLARTLALELERANA